MSAHFAIEAAAIAALLDELDYLQLLKLDRSAGIAEIRTAFHRESRTYHPDRFFHLEDRELQANVHRIYKRITEAYAVLRDDRKRARYFEDLDGPDREQRLRYTEASEQDERRAREEEIGQTPNGRRFYGAGLIDLEAGRAESALRNFRAALLYEPQNERYQEKADAAQRRLAGASK